MKLRDAKDVKKWLRSIPLIRKELELKANFYKDIAGDFEKLPDGKDRAAEYKEKVDDIQRRLDLFLAEVDRMFSLLNEQERLVMTAKYLRLVKWDFMEYQVYYSRRQAIRIHEAAVLKLVGQDVEEVAL